MRALAVPVLAALALTALPARAALPVSDPRCAGPVTGAPDPGALAGSGYVRVAADGTASWLLPGAIYATWTADGAKVAYWVRPVTQGLPWFLCAARGDGTLASVLDLGAPSATLAWSPDGTAVAYGSTDVAGGSRRAGRGRRHRDDGGGGRAHVRVVARRR